MEIKLTQKAPEKQEISLHPAAGKTAQAVREAQKTNTAIALQGQERRSKRIPVLRCGIAGMGECPMDLDEPGRQLRLVREPENVQDRWATRVCTLSGAALGYLPAQKNQSVARLMDAGKTITVFVDEAPDPRTRRLPGEDRSLPLILYMDIPVSEERER